MKTCSFFCLVLMACGSAFAQQRSAYAARDIERLEEQLQSLKEHGALVVEVGKLEEELKALSEREESLRKELEQAVKTLAERKEAALREAEVKRKEALEERAAAVGEKLDELVANDGKAYQEVTIREVDDVGMSIMHAAGTARIPAEDLPAELRRRFRFNEDVAAKIKKREAEIEREFRARMAAAEKMREEEAITQERTREDNTGRQQNRRSAERTVRPAGEVQTRVVATGRKRIAAKPEDLRTCIFINITSYDITVGFSQYDARTYREKFEHLKKLSISARANVPSSLRVNGTRVGEVQPGEGQVFTVVVAGRSGYEVELVSADGRTLDRETNLRKTGL